MFGLLATALVTDVIQLATGYHAPFFLTVCQPNYTAPGVSCDNNAYITQDICMGKDQYAIMSARWDAHASFQQNPGCCDVTLTVVALLSVRVQPVSVAIALLISAAISCLGAVAVRSCTRATAALRLFRGSVARPAVPTSVPATTQTHPPPKRARGPDTGSGPCPCKQHLLARVQSDPELDP